MEEHKYITVKEVLYGHNFPFTKGQLRAFITHKHTNGLDKAIRKIGRKIYFRLDLLQEWIENGGKL